MNYGLKSAARFSVERLNCIIAVGQRTRIVIASFPCCLFRFITIALKEALDVVPIGFHLAFAPAELPLIIERALVAGA